MKFKKPVARNPLPTGELRVDSMGRFGNYFFSSGLIEGFGSEVGDFEYQFAEHNRPVTPEYSFYHPLDGSESRVRFLHLFWINGGHQLIVGPGCPAVVAPKDDRKNGSVPRFAIGDLLENSFEVFLAAIDAMESRDVWSNRLVLEMIKHCNLDDRTGYFAVALDRVGWQTLDTEVAKILARKSGENTVREYLNFQCLCISNMDTRYLPSALKAKFIELIGELDLSENDRPLAHAVIRQLARFDSDRACEFAHSVITTLVHDRDELAVCVRHCYPQDSQWWIHHALVTPGLGPEQAADALNCAGTAAATQGQAALAKLSYEAALIVDPEAKSVAWNAGWFWAGLGDVEKAGELFKRVGRHYPHKSLSTRWPHVRDQPWPMLAMAMERFSLPAGVTRWPRITVVTPSFNQGHFIEETILSVLNQGYPNLQYIVVDGNSTDDTRQVLERYRDRFDHLIIESDKGQTEAINKGLRLADGDLVAWLNSDDMYAPGTLHTAALKWIANQADVIAGICIEHIERRMQLFNKPAATNSEFNPPQLARIFKYWLKGYYFYQPEVFFSKRILDTVGLLDESLYYSMDYDLWMRFAKAGAILEVVDWPFAFFRKHEAQKTSNLVDCVEEQARVRSRHFPLSPDEQRSHRIQRNLALLKWKKNPTVGILTKRLVKIFSQSIQRELDQFCAGGMSFHLSDDAHDPRIAGADMVILLAHVQEDIKTIGFLRAAKPDRAIIAWFWDNHHHLFENQATAEAVDVVLPGHALYGEYLRNDQAIYGGHVPLCVTQWARQDAAEWFKEFGGARRSDDLYGGFVEYVFEPARTEFLHRLMDMLPKHALTILSETNLKSYFGRSGKDRFAEWCRYQTSLILPLRNDLSQRVFDALLAGLIPLVPEEITDLDEVVPRELQESLPIIRFRMKDPASAVEAQRVAVGRFAEGGAEAARSRHLYALENHMFASRINRILDMLVLSDDPQDARNLFANPAAAPVPSGFHQNPADQSVPQTSKIMQSMPSDDLGIETDADCGLVDRVSQDTISGWIPASLPYATEVRLSIGGMAIRVHRAEATEGDGGERRRFVFKIGQKVQNLLPVGGSIEVRIGSRNRLIPFAEGVPSTFEGGASDGGAELKGMLETKWNIDHWGNLHVTFGGSPDLALRCAQVYAAGRALVRQSLGAELYITGGNLLGIVREGKFLDHDDDIDASYIIKAGDSREAADIFYSHVERLAPAAKDAGLRIKVANPLHMYLILPGKPYLDVLVGWHTPDGYWCRPSGYGGDLGIGLFSYTEVEYAGTVMAIPAHAETELVLTYGEGWNKKDDCYSKVRPSGPLSEIQKLQTAYKDKTSAINAWLEEYFSE